MEKRCCRCKEVKDVKEFYKDKYTKTGYKLTCKKCDKDYVSKKIVKNVKYRNQKNYKPITEKKCNNCGKVRDIKYFFTRTVNEDGFDTKCKICINTYNKKNFEHISLRHKEYNEKNKEQISLQQRNYKEKNKEKIQLYRIQYVKRNKKKIELQRKIYYKENKEQLNLEKIKWGNSNAKYKTYAEKLTIDESPRLHKDGESLEVLCKYCGKYFIPKNDIVDRRVSVLNGYASGDQYLYCSENCKLSCPIFGQVKYPKGFKKQSSREVNPLIRQMCFERDNWECQICGKSTDEVQLHCHHIEGYTQNPRLGNDIENVITLCKDCHKYVHTLPGCGFRELRCG